MRQYSRLLKSIANTIQDYRNYSLPQPVEDHVEKWVKQFEPSVQLSILQEMNIVLEKSYYSKDRVNSIINQLIHSQKIGGTNPSQFWRKATFLKIQGGGDSQSDMLALFSEQLLKEYGFGVEDCGSESKVFVYLDDCLFTSNRIRNDLLKWIRDESRAEAQIHIICIVLHREGFNYANKILKERIADSGNAIDLNWWYDIIFENHLSNRTPPDVLRPTSIPNDPDVIAYVASMKHQPTLRSAGNPGPAGLFSSDGAKIILEQEFLKAGVRIRRMCPNLSDTQRPLGHETLETLGFGSLVVTYRNCPNNAPLALWVDSPWYPLFRRTTNTQSAVRRSDEIIKEGKVR